MEIMYCDDIPLKWMRIGRPSSHSLSSLLQLPGAPPLPRLLPDRVPAALPPDAVARFATWLDTRTGFLVPRQPGLVSPETWTKEGGLRKSIEWGHRSIPSFEVGIFQLE